MTHSVSVQPSVPAQVTDSPPASFGRQNIIGNSPALLAATTLAQRVASSQATTVFLTGEAGTGKELFARAIHSASPASGEPIVGINCAALPEALLESELFGHEFGAFAEAREQKRGLLELAGSGTLYLAEISELPTRLQPKLLHALEQRSLRRLGGLSEIEIRCRVIASSKRPLGDAVSRGEFREDLLLRLDMFRIALPPLRIRDRDIELLAQHFLHQVARGQRGCTKTLDPDAITALHAHTWPGNVRELKIAVERATILSDGDFIRPAHLMIQHRFSRTAISSGALAAAEIQIPAEGKSLEQIEREAIALTLQLTRGNRSATARILGISRPTLARKMSAYSLR